MKLDLVAVGAHPDDVELACGGTLALAARAGKKIGIIHLTRGEMGTRGTVEERRREAERAAEILGAAELALLDCGDGGLRTGPDEEAALIELLRRWRPDIVLGPPPGTRHPDHARAHHLVEAAAFYAGLAKRRAAPPGGEELPPYRPAAVFRYMQHDSFEPRFVVDVTSVWEIRERAVSAYRSQVYQPDEPEGDEPEGDEPLTKIATRDFRLAIQGRARHFGSLVGATFGEPFGSRLPLAVHDPFDLLPGGVR